jgi:hypothetical protein
VNNSIYASGITCIKYSPVIEINAVQLFSLRRESEREVIKKARYLKRIRAMIIYEEWIGFTLSQNGLPVGH